MRDALAALPPDAYALACDAEWIAEQAEHLELFGVMHLARQLAAEIHRAPDLETSEVRERTAAKLEQLAAAIAAIDT